MNGKVKMVVLIIIGVLVAVGLTIATQLFIRNTTLKVKNSIKSKWDSIYYDYLKEIKDLGSDKAKLPQDMKNGTISFYDVDGIDYPIMNIKYESNNKECSNIYYIDEKSNDVGVIVFKDKTDIEMLYNKESKDYEYYIHTKKNDVDIYSSLKDQINEKLGHTKDIKQYKFESSDKDKFNEIFTKIKNKVQEYDFNLNFDLKNLKNMFLKSSKQLKKITKKITNEIEKMIENNEFDVNDIEKTIDAVESKTEEIEKIIDNKKDEIINSVNDVTDSNNYISVGSYNIKYGTYVGESASEGINLVLEKDGKCTYDNKPCTYKVGNFDFAQDESTKGSYKDCLVITSDYTYHFYPYSNSTLGDGGINSYTYNG